MAGVSVTESTNIDLDAIVAGGDAFMARIKDLQATKAAAETAFSDLKIGKDAAAAFNEAQATRQAATQTLTEANDQAAKTIAEAKDQAAKIITDAKDEATALMAFAKQGADGLDAQVASARKVLQDWSDKTTADANNIMAQAVAAKMAADRQLADNQSAAKKLADAQAQVEEAMKATQATQMALNAKLDAIKAAAS